MARREDLSQIEAIELAAAALFGDHDVPPQVLAEATPADELEAARRQGRLWVVRDADELPVGFALARMLGANPHLEEMDVLPEHARRGLGRALLESVCAWAREAGHDALTLTTFRDVPWNAPFYARAGFQALAPAQIPPELAAILRDEAARGLAPARRVAMRRRLRAR